MSLPDSAQRLNPLIACVAVAAMAAVSANAWAIDPFSMVLLLMLMALALTNDVMRLLGLN